MGQIKVLTPLELLRQEASAKEVVLSRIVVAERSMMEDLEAVSKERWSLSKKVEALWDRVAECAREEDV